MMILVQMNKKIIILSSVHPWDDTRIFEKEAKSLAKKFNVELHAIGDFDEMEIDGIRVFGHERGSRLFPIKIWIIYFKVALSARESIIHFHDPDLVLLGLILKIFGKTVIYDVHEDVSSQILDKSWIPTIIRKPISWLYNLFEKFCSSYFDTVIVVTEHIKKQFKEENTIIIHNYPRLEGFPLKTYEQNLDSPFRVIYVGLISAERGIFEIIEASKLIGKSPSIEINIIGSFASKIIEEDFYHRISESNASINYLGSLKYKDAMNLLYNSDAGLVCFHPRPNHINALPNKIFEYMRAGLPIVSSNFSLWKKIILDNNCGLTIDPLSPEEIAGAICNLAMNPDSAKSFGSNGRNLVEKYYNWENEEEKLYYIYSKLIDS